MATVFRYISDIFAISKPGKSVIDHIFCGGWRAG
jgi:hypothetical protein